MEESTEREQGRNKTEFPQHPHPASGSEHSPVLLGPAGWMEMVWSQDPGLGLTLSRQGIECVKLMLERFSSEPFDFIWSSCHQADVLSGL